MLLPKISKIGQYLTKLLHIINNSASTLHRRNDFTKLETFSVMPSY